MRLVEINWNPSDGQLRQFGGMALVALPAIAWLLSGRPWPSEASTWQIGIIAGFALVGALCALGAALHPQLLRPVFVGLSLVALPIGLVVGEIGLLAMYYLLFVPIGLVFRWIGRDALDRKLDRTAKSYWRAKSPSADLESYFRQS